MRSRNAPSWSRRDPFLKNPDSWLDVLLLDHIEVPLVRMVAKTPITPTSITVLSIASRLVSCAFFADLHFALGALLYTLGLVLDGMDGKLARITGRSSEFGRKLDYSSDFGLFALLWLTLGDVTSTASPVVIAGVSLGVTSAFATIMRKSPPPRERTLADRREMLRSPGVLEVHFVLFAVIPLLGQSAVEVSMYVATVYFAVTWLSKLRE